MPDKMEKKESTTTKKNTKTKKKTTKKSETNDRIINVIEKIEEEAEKEEKKKVNNKKDNVATENKKTTTKKTTSKDTKASTKNTKSKENKQSGEKKTTNNKENKALEKTKNTKNNLSIKQQEELEKIEEEIKKQTTLPKEKMNKIYMKVFGNILFAIIVLIYFILINIGFILSNPTVFITVLKAFSIACIIITICVFEYAYKKDSGKYAINGIELLALSICTLLSIRIYTIYNSKFIGAVTSFALLIAIYFVAKSIIIYIKKKKQIKKQISDIHKIAKKKWGKQHEKYDRLWKSKVRKK